MTCLTSKFETFEPRTLCNRTKTVLKTNKYIIFVFRYRAEENGSASLYDETKMQKEVTENNPSCPIADSYLNACNNIIDAAQYIGVTFDVRKGRLIIFSKYF
jgi:hypothetical protein